MNRSHYQARTLIRAALNTAAGTTRSFRAQVPDARVRLQLRLVGATSNSVLGNAYVGGCLVQTWIALCVQAVTGALIPIQNLAGVGTAWMTIPTDSYLHGHCVDVEYPSADGGRGTTWVWGQIGVQGDGSNVAEAWGVEAVWNAIVPLTDAEWSAIKRNCVLVTDAEVSI